MPLLSVALDVVRVVADADEPRAARAGVEQPVGARPEQRLRVLALARRRRVVQVAELLVWQRPRLLAAVQRGTAQPAHCVLRNLEDDSDFLRDRIPQETLN